MKIQIFDISSTHLKRQEQKSFPMKIISTPYKNIAICIVLCVYVFFIRVVQVAWIHIDRQMILTIHRHVIARIPRFGITHDSQKTWLLHVKGAQPEDRGYYMCQVNTNPMISQVGYLQVVGEYIFCSITF